MENSVAVSQKPEIELMGFSIPTARYIYFKKSHIKDNSQLISLFTIAKMRSQSTHQQMDKVYAS